MPFHYPKEEVEDWITIEKSHGLREGMHSLKGLNYSINVKNHMYSLDAVLGFMDSSMTQLIELNYMGSINSSKNFFSLAERLPQSVRMLRLARIRNFECMIKAFGQDFEKRIENLELEFRVEEASEEADPFLKELVEAIANSNWKVNLVSIIVRNKRGKNLNKVVHEEYMLKNQKLIRYSWF